ncbi:MAG: hypothetical protein HND53_12150 [Proteobacteria bacterium]|nr:hypothetical protein [Pseudomonadota bacterium]NOG61246.1 hypothetical protein [Pseudomonadota bacterium]
MNTKNITIALWFTLFLAGCSNQTSVQSTTSDKIVIIGEPQSFLYAYDMAKKECEKENKKTVYIADQNAGLDEVSFECVIEEEEVVANAETEADTEMEGETESETVEKVEIPEVENTSAE